MRRCAAELRDGAAQGRPVYVRETDPYGESSPQNILDKITDEIFAEETVAA